jgi:DNA-binding transcriptional regulator YiaG
MIDPPSGSDVAYRVAIARSPTTSIAALEKWEQGRRRTLDPQASLLVKALDRYPELMERVALDA